MARERRRRDNEEEEEVERVEPVLMLPNQSNLRIGNEISQVAGGMGEERFGDVVRTLDTRNGLERRTTSVGPYFCSCGNQFIPENVRRCSHCQRMICSFCTIEYEMRSHCEACFRAFHHNLDKRMYLTLLFVANRVSDEGDISELTGVPRDEVKMIIQSLPEYMVVDYILGIFRARVRVSMNGRDALYAYDGIYGQEDDVLRAKELLRMFLYERMIREASSSGLIERIFTK